MIANSEGATNEDGANEIGIINLRDKRLESGVRYLARGTGGHQASRRAIPVTGLS